MFDTNDAAEYGQVEFVENIFSPEIFASEATFFAIGPGTLHITFTSARFENSDAGNKLKKVVIGRLVMPLSGAEHLAAGLYDFLKKQGLMMSADKQNAN